MKLNVGCGNDRRDGFVNCDNEPSCLPDLWLDLEGAWPLTIPSGSVTEIVARHVLEHLRDVKTFFRQAYSRMAPDALMHIAVPHHRSEGFSGDFTHVTAITRPALDLLSKKKCDEFREKGWPNTPLAYYWGVNFEVESVDYDLMPHWKSRGLTGRNLEEAIATYFNVVDEVRFVLRRI